MPSSKPEDLNDIRLKLIEQDQQIAMLKCRFDQIEATMKFDAKSASRSQLPSS
jgi:hypothetical protein